MTPENRSMEPCAPAFLAAFVSDLCPSAPKHEPGSGTPPSSCSVWCRKLTTDDAKPGSSCKFDSIKWHCQSFILKLAAPRSTNRTICKLECSFLVVFFFFPVMESPLHAASMPQLSLMVAAAQEKGRALGSPSSHWGYCSHCKMVLGSKKLFWRLWLSLMEVSGGSLWGVLASLRAFLTTLPYLRAYYYCL